MLIYDKFFRYPQSTTFTIKLYYLIWFIPFKINEFKSSTMNNSIIIYLVIMYVKLLITKRIIRGDMAEESCILGSEALISALYQKRTSFVFLNIVSLRRLIFFIIKQSINHANENKTL